LSLLAYRNIFTPKPFPRGGHTVAVLITGATGTNGLEVVKQVLARGGRVRALVRNRGAAATVLPSDVEFFEGDFTERVSVIAALRGMERAFVLAAVHERMGEFEEQFIDAAREARIAHVVQFSAIGAHPGSKGFFPRVHGCAEVSLVNSGLAYTIVQPSFFMQNLLWSASTIKADGAIYNTAGSGAAGHVHARDIAAVAAVALTEPIERHAGEIYLVTGPERLTYVDIAQKLSGVLGRAVKHVSLAASDCRQAMVKGGMPGWQADAILDLDARCRNGDFSAVTDVVQRVTGKPPATLEQFAKENAGAFSC
jgi:uncharacterized protein YbjT (DUF2867 family)